VRRLGDETAVSLQQKLKDEIKAVAITTLYFATWLGLLVLLKKLILEEYQIEFHGLSVALVGALVLAKVVLVLEHVSLGTWVRSRTDTWKKERGSWVNAHNPRFAARCRCAFRQGSQAAFEIPSCCINVAMSK